MRDHFLAKIKLVCLKKERARAVPADRRRGHKFKIKITCRYRLWDMRSTQKRKALMRLDCIEKHVYKYSNVSVYA